MLKFLISVKKLTTNNTHYIVRNTTKNNLQDFIFIFIKYNPNFIQFSKFDLLKNDMNITESSFHCSICEY